ncbi:MAG TPA: RNA polymerase subunit sigma [Treponema sp.]|nr:RNA polymerase subunit sigma [Treponema sp.]HBB43622.1 RNA polymerase subunit sigma [Treponema sp.]HCA19384.1 RNA polymerase subunit sigma [Treponema sp.]
MTNDENVLNMYLKEINKIPLLTREQETELAVKAAAGDKKAKETIVKANLRFVVNVAKKYQNQGLDLLDLISEGNIGLLTAIDRFDVSKGYHFISYAVWWIRQAILKAICEKSRAIRLPLNRVNELVKIEKARKVVGTNKSEEQEITEIGAMLGMETSHVREMLNLSKEMVSLDMQVPGDGAQKRTLGDFLEDNTVPSPDEQAMNTAMKEELNSVLKTLRPNEEKVLRLRYGLNGEKPMSLKEVGDVCNLTKERIRQIEKRALVRMQHPVRLTRLEAYVA